MAEIPAEEIRKAFERDGAYVVEAMFSEDEIILVRRLLDRYLAEEPGREFSNRPEYRERFETALKIWRSSAEPAAIELFSSPRMKEYTEAILGTDFETRGAVSFCTPKGCGQGWHQDTGEVDPGQWVLNRFVYCHDETPDQGPLYWVPGSQHSGDLSEGDNHEEMPEQVSISPPAGTVVFLHSRCWHRVGLNQTDRPRILINDRARPKGARPDLANFAVFRGDTWCHSEGKPWR